MTFRVGFDVGGTFTDFALQDDAGRLLTGKRLTTPDDPAQACLDGLADLLAEDVVLALKWNGRDLEPDHGGPLRLVLPALYFWKSSKWLRAFELLEVNAPGFWEENGYHMNADPWREERYSDQETRAMQEMRAAAARRLRGR